MVKRNGYGGNSSSSDQNLRSRIEGFGNTPMPPPVSDNFEDRLHSALAQDETIGDWYNSARASLDSMVTAFDDTVNAIADTIEDTVAAVVGDDDPWEPEQQQPKNQNQRRGSKGKGDKDDGERSGTKWEEIVAAICEEGDLDNFVFLAQSQPVNVAEEKEVAGLLSKHLLKAEKNSEILRVLYVMQAVEEGDLPVVIDVIRELCKTKLEKLQASSFFKALATQVLGPGPSGANKPEEKEEKADAMESSDPRMNQRRSKDGAQKTEKAQEAKPAAKPVDLLAFAEPEAKPKGNASSSAPMVDLLDSSPAAGPAPTVDLLDTLTPSLMPALQAQPAQPATDLFSLQGPQTLQAAPAPAPAATNFANFGVPPAPPASSSFAAFQSAPPAPPQQNAGQWAAFQSAPANAGPANSANLFQSSASPSFMSPPSMPANMGAMSAPGVGMGMPSSNQSFDMFDPNPKPSMPSGPAPAQKMVTGTAAASDPFSSLNPLAGVSPSGPAPSSVNSGSMGAGGFSAGKNQQPAAAKKDLQLDDVLGAELAKMQVAN